MSENIQWSILESQTALFCEIEQQTLPAESNAVIQVLEHLHKLWNCGLDILVEIGYAGRVNNALHLEPFTTHAVLPVWPTQLAPRIECPGIGSSTSP